MRLVFDIETNGLLDQTTTIHCLVAIDADTQEVYQYGPGQIEEGLRFIQGHDLIGHNIIKFDIPAIKKLYPWWSPDPEKVTDTLVCARLIWSNISDRDLRLFKKGQFPGKYIGQHGLAAWGARLGAPKDDYSDRMKAQGLDPWVEWNQDMQDYCVQDVRTNLKLLELIDSKDYPARALKLEHDVAWIVAQMERNGFPFDTRKAASLYAELVEKRDRLTAELQSLFPPWYEKAGVVTPKAGNKKFGYVKDAPYTKLIWFTFNPTSRQHIAKMFERHYGWKPTEFTEKGTPKIDETILAKLKFPAAKRLSELFLIAKRIGQIGEGEQAWLKLETNGRLHGSVNSNGAVTGRATHANPNVAQVPSVGKPYGQECRELFGPGEGRVQVGADASGLELRCLGHYMARYDGGKYADTVVNGDIHTENQKAAGLPTRGNAKSFIYAFLYGAGDAKIGEIVGKGPKGGAKLKERFLKQTPALARLRDAVQATVKKRGYLIGLDGRHLHSRSAHSALNLLLQSAGALICKQWLVVMEQNLAAAGLKHGWDGDYALMAWVHDEVQVSCKDQETAEKVAAIAVESIKQVTDIFNFNCPLTGEAKLGSNWAECH